MMVWGAATTGEVLTGNNDFSVVEHIRIALAVCLTGYTHRVAGNDVFYHIWPAADGRLLGIRQL